MNSLDYTIFYKKNYKFADSWNDNSWDLFISAFNSSERVQKVFEKVTSRNKHWLILQDYEYKESEYPNSGIVFAPTTSYEADFIQQYFDESQLDIKNKRICIDITGFMRPHLMFLVNYLWRKGVNRFDALYSDPQQYVKKDETKFSDEVVSEVRQVAGFEGNHIIDTSNDILIIGAGYDHELIAHVAESKDKAKKFQIFGLPSLQADMYQESVLRTNRVALNVGVSRNCFAPANDPFVTASVLQEIVNNINKDNNKTITNLYLSPLATKTQTLGFTLYYLMECQSKSASIIFPMCNRYARETSMGISRVWKYVIEFPQNYRYIKATA